MARKFTFLRYFLLIIMLEFSIKCLAQSNGDLKQKMPRETGTISIPGISITVAGYPQQQVKFQLPAAMFILM
jgi:hypothetical protein